MSVKNNKSTIMVWLVYIDNGWGSSIGCWGNNMFNFQKGVAMQIRTGFLIVLMTGMIGFIPLVGVESASASRPRCSGQGDGGCPHQERKVTKDTSATTTIPATTTDQSAIAQLQQLMNEFGSWAKQGLEEHPYWSAGCGITAALLLYLLSHRAYRDVSDERDGTKVDDRTKGCCSKTAGQEAVLTAQDVCEEHGCACLVDGKCPCTKDERGTCGCSRKRMQERDAQLRRHRMVCEEAARATFLKKIVDALREYKQDMELIR